MLLSQEYAQHLLQSLKRRSDTDFYFFIFDTKTPNKRILGGKEHSGKKNKRIK